MDEPSRMNWVLSWVQVEPLLKRRNDLPQTVKVSLDLGLSEVEGALETDGLHLPDGQQLSWGLIEEISANQSACYQIAGDDAYKVQLFSEEFNRVYTLMPTKKAPTLLISGIPMHRIKDIDPYEDTRRKIRTIAPVKGTVLDTAMGLGYTAIEAAKTAYRVITIELDPAVETICRSNPWSQELFDNPKIERQIGDAYDLIGTFKDGKFSRIIHDPPTFSLAGRLYSLDFYRELYRVLAPRGRLFHYIGDPHSKSGRGITRGASRRLQEAGFHRVVPKQWAFGILAIK